MKFSHIRVVSDLHLEFGRGLTFARQEFDSSTLLILAGDIGTPMELLLNQFLAKCSKQFAHVLYLLGNHEFYNGDINTSMKLLVDDVVQAKLSNVTVFTDATKFEFDGFRILGGTLWTNLDDGKPETKAAFSKYMYDSRVILNGNNRFTPEDSINLFDKTVSQFIEWLEEPFDGKTMIVTHHLPTISAVSERFLANDLGLNGCFYSELGPLMQKYDISHWFFGHTHDSVDKVVWSTRLICNPRGYPNRNIPGVFENNGFDPNLLIAL